MRLLNAIRKTAETHPRRVAALICLMIVIGTTGYAIDHYRFHNVPTVELRPHCLARGEDDFDHDGDTSYRAIEGPSSREFRMFAALMAATHRTSPMLIADDRILITRAKATNYMSRFARSHNIDGDPNMATFETTVFIRKAIVTFRFLRGIQLRPEPDSVVIDESGQLAVKSGHVVCDYVSEFVGRDGFYAQNPDAIWDWLGTPWPLAGRFYLASASPL